MSDFTSFYQLYCKIFQKITSYVDLVEIYCKSYLDYRVSCAIIKEENELKSLKNKPWR